MMYLEMATFEFTVRTDDPRPNFHHVGEFFCAMSRIPEDCFRVTDIVCDHDGSGVYRHKCKGALVIRIEESK